MRIYIVQKGDTLYKIAQTHHVTVEDIMRLNPHIADPNQIDIGMKIKIPPSFEQRSVEHHEGKAEKKIKFEARTPERPLNSINDFIDNTANQSTSRFPLTNVGSNRQFLRNNVPSQDGYNFRKAYQPPYDSNEQQPVKPYAMKQYKYHHDSQFNPNEIYHHHTHGYMQQPIQPLRNSYPHCPCCMYHMQLNQPLNVPPQPMPNHLSQQPPQQPPQQLSQQMPQQLSQQMPQRPSQQMSQRRSDTTIWK